MGESGLVGGEAVAKQGHELTGVAGSERGGHGAIVEVCAADSGDDAAPEGCSPDVEEVAAEEEGGGEFEGFFVGDANSAELAEFWVGFELGAHFAGGEGCYGNQLLIFQAHRFHLFQSRFLRWAPVRGLCRYDLSDHLLNVGFELRRFV